MIKPFRTPAALLIIATISIALTACGSGGAKSATPQDTEIPSVAVIGPLEPADTTDSAKSEDPVNTIPAPADMTAQTKADKPVEAAIESGESATADVASVRDSVALESSVPAAVSETAAGTESALLTSYADYGFSLKLDLGAEIQAAGWTEPEPSLTQGIIAFAYGGVNANIVWGPPEKRTALTFLADTYNILRASQPSVTFESISDGDISIAEQEGVYGGFKAADDSGSSLGGGLIGAWICPDSETAFRMTLTGEDATVVQLRFDRLLENFKCSTS